MMENYELTTNKLVSRISQLIPQNPHILEMTSAFDLFKIDGFKCNDLDPSLFQAGWALTKAQQTYNK